MHWFKDEFVFYNKHIFHKIFGPEVEHLLSQVEKCSIFDKKSTTMTILMTFSGNIKKNQDVIGMKVDLNYFKWLSYFKINYQKN